MASSAKVLKAMKNDRWKCQAPYLTCEVRSTSAAACEMMPTTTSRDVMDVVGGEGAGIG